METWKLCYGCMRRKQESLICEHCGYSEEENNLPHQLPQGQILKDQYVVGRVLGQGGFGITYLGYDQMLNRRVAIKEYFPSGMVTRETTRTHAVTCTSGEDIFRKGRERFLQEAQTLAKLQNVAEIARVYAFFEENDTAYIVMEYVEGETLQEHIHKAGGKLTPQETLILLKPIITALSKVHQAGMIHRDISPDNIMITKSGSVKLLDFGTARDVDPVSNHATRSTQAVLKYGYAPMEQYRSRGKLGPWTDEYALCATVYCCLTGQVPPEAPTRLVENTEVNWGEIPGLTARQVAALQKGMALRSEERFETVEEFGSELYQEGSLRKATKSATRSLRKLPWEWRICGGTVVVAVIIILTLLLPSKDSVSTVLKSPIEMTTPEATEPMLLPEPWESNVLMWDTDIWRDPVPANSPYLGTELRRGQVYSITFLDSLEQAPEDAWDVSEAQNGSVLLWAEPVSISIWEQGGMFGYGEEWEEELMDVYIAAEGGINGRNASGFEQCNNLREIIFQGNYHTDECTTMSQMFSGCKNLTSVDISSINTSNVSSMSHMFDNCSQLRFLDLSGFDTSKVTDMSYMFWFCDALVDLDVSSFDTAQVTYMQQMFYYCSRLGSLDISGFDTTNVVDMSRMFDGCWNLKYLDISNFNTSNVTDMNSMFSSCTNIERLDVSGFDTSKVNDMSFMFHNMEQLMEIDLTGFNTVQVENMSAMFSGCKNLSTVDLSDFDTIQVRDMHGMFEGCWALTSLDLSGFDTTRVTNMSRMFYSGVDDEYRYDGERNSLVELNLGEWETISVSDYTEFMDRNYKYNGQPWEQLFEDAQ